MIDLDGAVISEEKFKAIAEREGYVKEFEYPIYMQDVDSELVVKFLSLRKGVVIVCTEWAYDVGDTCNDFFPHTDTKNWKEWQPHEEHKKQYAADVQGAGCDARLHVAWEYKDKGQSDWHDCLTTPQWYPETKYRRKGITEEFDYPIYMESLGDGLVVKFTDLRAGEVVAGETHFISLGYKSENFVPHNNNSHWKEYQPHESLKIQYAEDAKSMIEPWKLWEWRGSNPNVTFTDCKMPLDWEVERKYRRKETKTYDGLTESQWNQVRDEGLLCEFWNVDDTITEPRGAYKLSAIHKGEVFKFCDPYNTWQHCIIHRAFPQFVIDGKKPDWLDDDTTIAVQYKDAKSFGAARGVRWSDATRFQVVGWW